MKDVLSVEDFRYGCKILLYDRKTGPQLRHYWSGFRYNTYNKFQWFFRYRSALLQVQHPQNRVEIIPFSFEYTPPIQEKIKRLKYKLKSAKAIHTTWSRKIELAKKNWHELLPIEEHPHYIRALAKVQEKQISINELQLMIEHYEQLGAAG